MDHIRHIFLLKQVLSKSSLRFKNIFVTSLLNWEVNHILNSGHVWFKITEFNFHGQPQIKNEEEDHELHSFYSSIKCVTFFFDYFEKFGCVKTTIAEK